MNLDNFFFLSKMNLYKETYYKLIYNKIDLTWITDQSKSLSIYMN